MGREVEIGHFKGKTVEGKEYTIIHFKEFISSSSGEVPGMKRYRTAEGLDLAYVDPGTYKIVLTGETVIKV